MAYFFVNVIYFEIVKVICIHHQKLTFHQSVPLSIQSNCLSNWKLLSYESSCPSVGWLVGLGGKLHFPLIRALVLFYINTPFKKPVPCDDTLCRIYKITLKVSCRIFCYPISVFSLFVRTYLKQKKKGMRKGRYVTNKEIKFYFLT